jgi:hypothetical protein
MILETGKNLSVLIVTEADMNWQTFATWYSFFKNLPDAKIGIFCHRSDSAPFMYFQWAKRLGIKRINAWPFSEEGPELLNWLECVRSSEAQELVTQPVLVVKPYVMALNLLDKTTLSRFNSEGIWVNQNACFINKKNVKDLINQYYLENKEFNISQEKICFEAKEEDVPRSLVCYNKGCGRWIDKAKGCPFSNAGGLITAEMTANETKIIDLWNKMVPLYHAVV